MDQEKLSRLYAEGKTLLPLLIIVIIVLSMPYYFRDKSLSLIGGESYNYARLAENPLKNYDELSYGGRFLVFNAYPLILSLFSRALNIDLMDASKTLPIILGIMALMLFYFILKKLETDKLTLFLACLILAISPPFVYMFTVSNTYIIPIILALLSFLLLLHDKKTIAYPVFFATIFFGIAPFLISLALLTIYSVKTKSYKGLYLLLLVLLLLIPIIKLGLPEFIGFDNLPEGINFRMQTFISELGGEIGLSIFAILLSLFGLKQLWHGKYEHIAVYIAIATLMIAYFFEIRSLLYLNFFISMLAAIGIVRLLYQKWDSVIINLIIGVILILGLISSIIFTIGTLANALPNKDVIDSFAYLNRESKENAVVFSYYVKGQWISSLGKRKNVMDENFFYAPSLNERYNDSETLLHTKDINAAESIINKYKIKYIWIDNTMKNGQVWNENDEGLLFLLRASNKFKRDYVNDYIEIWKVVG